MLLPAGTCRQGERTCIVNPLRRLQSMNFVKERSDVVVPRSVIDGRCFILIFQLARIYVIIASDIV